MIVPAVPAWVKFALVFCAGVSAALLGFYMYGHGTCDEWRYLNHDYVCHHKHEIAKTPYYRLEVQLGDFIKEQRRLGKLERATIYFRDLHQGPAFGIDEDVHFTPASLLKLPMVIAYFTYAHEHPEILDVKLVYSKDDIHLRMLRAIEVAVPPLTEGTSYTISELMRSAIIYSDNLSYYLLVEYFNTEVPDGPAEILRVFQELGVVDPHDTSEEVVTARNYSVLLRLLYNASYLSEVQSDTLLSWLAQSTFNKGLVAGVPRSVDVANKFGERENSDGSRELFDCGVIYYSANPYILCVMTRGWDWADLQNVISTISETVYKEVDSRRI